MIQPTPKDMGREVMYREYRGDERFQVGRWLVGRLRGIHKMFVVVEFDESIRELCRSDLEYVT